MKTLKELQAEVADLKIQMRQLQRFMAQQPLNNIQTSPAVQQSAVAQRIPIRGNTFYIDGNGQAYLYGIALNTLSPLSLFHLLISTGTALDTNKAMRLNVGPAAASSGTFTRDSTSKPPCMVCDSGTLTDDGLLYLIRDAVIAPYTGFGFVTCQNSGVTGSAPESTFYKFDNTNGITLFQNTAAVVTTNTDGNLCLLHTAYSAGVNPNYIRARNRLGGTLIIGYFCVYWGA